MFIEEERRSKEKIPALEIYTDGSLKKLGPHVTCGGWAFLAIRENKLFYEGSGYEANTTNQRMELTAIVEGLKYATEIRRPNEKVIFYSDSAYAINCYEQEWYLKWQDNGWKNSKKESVANQDLWLEIIPYFNNFWYSFKKVPGHAQVFWNEKCDAIAQNQAEYLKINWRGNVNG